MRLGIDVGGTHTDAVAVDREGNVTATAKVRTVHEDLLVSVRAALENVLMQVDAQDVARLNLSTTLSTNAIVEGRTEDVGVFVSSGPGVDPESFRIGRHYYTFEGSIDHRGEEVAALDGDSLESAVALCRREGVRVFAAVSKFSTRNPAHENIMHEAITSDGTWESEAEFVTLGHRISGMLNFPRRISTAYYNAAVWRTFNAFADAVEGSVRHYGIKAPVNILKADGGTMPLSLCRGLPVESILSGPSASVMGIIALCDVVEDCVILDIGGTTTDIAVFAAGAPVIEPEGISVGSYPTLVRAMKTRSIGIGGDSRLRVVRGDVRVGPERVGPPLCMGGTEPTLMDAFNYLGLAGTLCDREESERGIAKLAGLWDIFPEALARRAVDYAVAAIRKAVEELVAEINARPVYTIMELLEGRKVRPRKAYVMGGPARAFQSLLAESLGWEVETPRHYEVANAIGAAMTRTTQVLELFADTDKGVMFIPVLDIEKRISSRYSLEEAERDARRNLIALLKENDPEAARRDDLPVDIVEAQSFNMVGDFSTLGRNIRVKAQVRPGVNGPGRRGSNGKNGNGTVRNGKGGR